MQKDLKRIADNTNFTAQYVEVLSFFYGTGLLDYLRNVGMQPLRNRSINAEIAALNGQRAAGFQECLDLIENFVDLVLVPLQNKDEGLPRPTFGSLNRATDSGDIDLEEQEALRDGKQPDYSKYINYSKPTDSGSSS